MLIDNQLRDFSGKQVPESLLCAVKEHFSNWPLRNFKIQ